jgi:aerobic-type carbon monoxide dehydrogenase small subunit (CoxS/CutS family)
MVSTPKGPPDDRGSFTRRAFLKGGAAGAVTSGLLADGIVGPEAAAASRDVVGPGPCPIALRINGKVHTLELEPRVTLLEALRHELELTGAKNVCDRGTCGACTVLFEGAPVYACSVLAIDAQGREITTIEGLGTPDDMSAVQRAFVENDAQQCGFCTPGFVVACHAFLDRHPDPTREEIDAGLGGNLCRCGTYVGIREAVLQAAKEVRRG